MARTWYGEKRTTKEDKYTRGRHQPLTRTDVRQEYSKMVLYLLAGYAYFHFVMMGWTW